MSSWALDENGDLETTGNRLTLTQGREAIRQHLQVKFRLFLGEWFLDRSLGVPYFEKILLKNPNLVEVSDFLKVYILETPGVTGLESFQFAFDLQGRELRLEFRANTIDGPIDFVQVVEI
ncbi:MAG TPA: hypothetical protein VFW62_11390 [bacterium]|nr:hypothetical protein [bacterium]